MLALLVQSWLLLTLGLLGLLTLVVAVQWAVRKVRSAEPLVRRGYDVRARAGA